MVHGRSSFLGKHLKRGLIETKRQGLSKEMLHWNLGQLYSLYGNSYNVILSPLLLQLFASLGLVHKQQDYIYTRKTRGSLQTSKS